jgi:hypothetical protein
VPILLRIAQMATAPKTTAIARTTTNCGISDAFLSNNINVLLSPDGALKKMG